MERNRIFIYHLTKKYRISCENIKSIFFLFYSTHWALKVASILNYVNVIEI